MSAVKAPRHRIVVDGSNLATEGRTTPSLAQLDEAVRAYLEENPGAEVIVVADATFEHRVAPSERARFKEAELAGEIVTPPAGAVGRGDAFILKIAARIGAVVLSNDSFQEFHEEHPWLFEPGRLIGGKPVAGVGWVFTPRLPVRGAKSARATKKLTVALPPGVTPTIGATITPAKAPVKVPAKTVVKTPAKTAKAAEPAKRTAKKAAEPARRTAKKAAEPAKRTAKKAAESAKPPATKAPSSRAPATKTPSSKIPAPKAPAKRSTPRAETPGEPRRSARGTRGSVEPATPAVALRRGRQPVNPEGDFARFVAEHRVRSHVDGEVVAFSSHGAIIAVSLTNGARVECYAPTTSLGTPPPARARDVLKRGDRRTFRLLSVDRDRRIAELALL
jgi:hypothetical protein